MITKTLSVLFLCTSLTFFAPPASAESLVGDRFSLSLGVFLTDRDTNTRFDSSFGDGTDVDLEDDLGLDARDNVFRIDGYFRFSERHRVNFSTFDLSRSSSVPIKKDIRWGDAFYTIDTVVEADFDLAIYKAAYTYSFLHSEDGYLGVSLGLYVLDAYASLAEQNIGRAEVGDITAPLPVVGLRGEHQLAERWTFRASGEFFFVEYDNIDGSLVDLFVGVEYALLDRLSIGAGFNSVKLDYRVKKTRFRGNLDWQYRGGLAYFKLSF